MVIISQFDLSYIQRLSNLQVYHLRTPASYATLLGQPIAIYGGIMKKTSGLQPFAAMTSARPARSSIHHQPERFGIRGQRGPTLCQSRTNETSPLLMEPVG